jgi:predicted RNase H-like nuclease
VRYNGRVADTRFLGIDLAWREGNDGLLANETGVAVIDEGGRILDAGWTRGVEQTVGWANIAAGDGEALMFADAPLVVRNDKGQRLCETQAGQRYGRWKVSANTTNIHSPRLAGVQFLRLAGMSGWRYSDGSNGPPRGGHFISETYPYATLVGAAELGYDSERPRYKRKPPRVPASLWRPGRAANCDTLIRRLGQLAGADPPLLLRSHPVTRDLADQPSPAIDSAYKHREDLIDALLCAWTASLWARHSFDRCQVLGLPANPTGDPAATMIVAARPEQRPHPLPESGRTAALIGSNEYILAAGRESAFALQFAPAAHAVVSDDLPEHSAQSRRIDGLALADGNSAGGLVVVTSGDDSLGIRDNAAVVEEYVDMILGRQQRADVALEHEVRLPAPLDGFGHLRVGGVHQLADLTADRLLPVRQGLDVGIDALVCGARHGSSLPWPGQQPVTSPIIRQYPHIRIF